MDPQQNTQPVESTNVGYTNGPAVPAQTSLPAATVEDPAASQLLAGGQLNEKIANHPLFRNQTVVEQGNQAQSHPDSLNGAMANTAAGQAFSQPDQSSAKNNSSQIGVIFSIIIGVIIAIALLGIAAIVVL